MSCCQQTGDTCHTSKGCDFDNLIVTRPPLLVSREGSTNLPPRTLLTKPIDGHLNGQPLSLAKRGDASGKGGSQGGGETPTDHRTALT